MIPVAVKVYRLGPTAFAGRNSNHYTSTVHNPDILRKDTGQKQSQTRLTLKVEQTALRSQRHSSQMQPLTQGELSMIAE